jgi:hypothetical protein
LTWLRDIRNGAARNQSDAAQHGCRFAQVTH